jgi:hypothetical protein
VKCVNPVPDTTKPHHAQVKQLEKQTGEVCRFTSEAIVLAEMVACQLL